MSEANCRCGHEQTAHWYAEDRELGVFNWHECALTVAGECDCKEYEPEWVGDAVNA